MLLKTAIGIMIPFLGTTLGSACVFLMKKQTMPNIEKWLLGSAAGVMTAASCWSLLIPAIERSSGMGRLAFLPSAVGTASGIAFLIILDNIIPHLQTAGSPEDNVSKTKMLCLAVTLHNIPEGMAPGVLFAAVLNGQGKMSAALALAIGIAIQNFPEGAVISLPLAGEGESKVRAFFKGTLSGAAEPAAAVFTLLLTGFVTSLLPYLLSFAAGAMLYVVVEELIPEASSAEHSKHGTVSFGLGFILMMILDVALG